MDMSGEIRAALTDGYNTWQAVGERQEISVKGYMVVIGGNYNDKLYRIFEGKDVVFKTAFYADAVNWLIENS